MAREFYVNSGEIPPAPVPGTPESRPQPQVADKRPTDAGDCAGLDAPQWRPLAPLRNRASVPGPVGASAPPRLAQWSAGGALAPHARRRRRSVEIAGVPGVSLGEGLSGLNRAGDSRPRGAAMRRQPIDSRRRWASDRGGLPNVREAARRSARPWPGASNTSWCTGGVTSGCRAKDPGGRQDSIRSGRRTSPGVPLMSAVFGPRSRSKVET